jgi:hypothetical protein
MKSETELDKKQVKIKDELKKEEESDFSGISDLSIGSDSDDN